MKTKPLAISTLFLGATLAAPLAQAEGSIVDAIKNGDANLSFRMRYEDVDQDASPSDLEGQAMTLRTRLNYQSQAWNGLTGFIEVDNVTELDEVDYNDSNNGRTDKAGISDPEGTEVNQAWLSYTRGATTGKWGRQRIVLDNHRFIGNVGWRQNEQTYDALTLTNKSLKDTNIFLGYLTNVNRIFGEDSAVGDVKLKTKLINVSYSGLPIGMVTGYGYLTDSEDGNTAFDSWDNNTWGLRFTGKQTSGDWGFDYSVEFARQSDAEDNPASYDADYLLLEAGVSIHGITLKAGQETLGADGSDGYFITPFATLHKFQGWTDKFLNKGKGNIPGGIVDSYASLGGAIAGVNLMVVYHDFESDDTAAADGIKDQGDEWGLLISKKISEVNLLLKYASYDEGDSSLGDTDKLWLSAEVAF